MDSSSKKRVEQEATELSEKILKIAEMVSGRKLSNKQRSAYQRLLVKASSFLSNASESGSESALNLAKRIIHLCEINLLASEKGEGVKINIPENSEIQINGSDFINIINQALHEKEKSFWEKYWRELIVVIVTAFITTVINYFI